ncbi:MAG: hypothetical protein KBD57_05955 [Bacteroidia bacterium]|nr:hypothetical protein [Bacteroidia bacterium]
MKKFRTKYNDSIECFEVVKETPKQIIYLTERGIENRESKESNWQNWFDTKEQAVEFLIEKCKKAIKEHERGISYQNEKIAKIQNL